MIKAGIRVKEVAINVLCFETLIGIAVCCVFDAAGRMSVRREDNRAERRYRCVRPGRGAYR